MGDSLWLDLLARVALPVLLWLTCVGFTLAAERVLRFRLPSWLLAPAGLGPTMTLALVGHELGIAPWIWAGALLLIAVAGLVGARGELSRVAPGWAVAVFAATYALYALPVLLARGWTWGGYNFLNDTSVQFLLSSWIQDGAHAAAFQGSSPGITLRMFIDTSYPMGTHAHLAALDYLLGLRPEGSYQVYVSALAAMGSVAAFGLLRAARATAAFAAGAAVVAMGANLTFQYALQGSVKEIGFVAVLLATAALSRELLTNARPVGVAVLWGLGAAGGLAAYSAAGLPYLGLLGVLTVGFVLARRDLPLRTARLPALGAGVAALVMAALPSAQGIIDFAKLVNGIYVEGGAGGGSPLGQLQAPLPAWQGLGVWLNGQYIFRVPPGTALTMTHVGALAVALLAVAAVVFAVRRREPAPLLVAAPAVIAYALLSPRTTPYADAKMLAIGAPGVVLAAGWAASQLARGRAWVAGAGVAGLVAVAVLLSDAMALHDVRLAPTGRMQDLAAMGHRYAGRGPILDSEFEEFGKYFARDTNLNAATESVASKFIALRQSESFLGYSYDLDAQLDDYVTSFPYILVRRSPSASRPPAMYRLDARNTSYEMWRRAPAPRLVAHLPLGTADHAAAVPSCADVAGLARRARAAGRDAALVAARAPEAAVLDLAKDGVPARAAHVSPGWLPDALSRDALWMATPGSAHGDVRVLGGRYGVWVRGSFSRPLEVRVDGRTVGHVRGVNTPGGWFQAGTVGLPRGAARIEVVRPGGRPVPGDGARSSIGAVALWAATPERLVRVAPTAARRLCGQPWDWIEVVRP